MIAEAPIRGGQKRPSPEDRARAQARKALYTQLAGCAVSLGNYDSARTTRLRKESTSGHRGGSADGHRDFITRDRMRQYCQDLDRNNVLARGLTQRLIDMVVGDGFSLQVRSADPEWNARASRLFGHWAGTCYDAEFADVPTIDMRGRCTIDDFAAENVRCALVDGDVGYVKTVSGQIQGIEGERIRNPSKAPIDGRTAEGTQIVGGVEMDAAGRTIRFHLSEWSKVGGTFAQTNTAPIDAEHFLFLANPLRNITGSTRGEPQLQASVERFEHLDGFDEAVRVAARIHAILSAFIVVERPDLHGQVWPGTTVTQTNLDGEDEEIKQDELEPGLLTRLKPGESIETVTSTQPGPEYQSFVFTQILMICSDLGLPLPLALLDGRQVNLSSIRSVLQFAWRNFERWQEWLRCRWYSEVYRWRIAMFIREGLLPYREDWAAHDWVPPAAPVMDPKLEIEAARAAVDARFTSMERVMKRMSGIDFASEMDKIEAEQELLRQKGILPVAAPGSVTPTNSGTDPNQDPSQDPNQDPSGDPNADPNADPASDPNQAASS